MSGTPESKGSPGPWRWDTNPELWGNTPYPRAADGTWVSLSPGADANRALIIRAPEMAALLRELEWAGMSNYNASAKYGRVTEDDWGPSCPVCGQGQEGKVHESDCRLSALLKSLP